jgi:hypothetical protein
MTGGNHDFGALKAPEFSSRDGTRSAPAPLQTPDEAPQPLVPPRRPLPGALREPDMSYGDSMYGAQQTGFRRDDPASLSPPTPPAQQSAAEAELYALLRRLDAKYCLLERWEDNPPRYRFHCRVTLGPGLDPKRFEAAGSEPLQLMREVADQVAAWRAKRGSN